MVLGAPDTRRKISCSTTDLDSRAPNKPTDEVIMDKAERPGPARIDLLKLALIRIRSPSVGQEKFEVMAETQGLRLAERSPGPAPHVGNFYDFIQVKYFTTRLRPG